jgi:hypothetical protein
VSCRHDDLERLLRSGRPTPRPAFVRELEDSLLPQRRPERPRIRLRVAIAAAGLAAVLAALAIFAGTAGLLPFSSGNAPNTEAKPTCQRVIVDRRERRAYFVRDRNGDIRVRYRVVTVPRAVKRCR